MIGKIDLSFTIKASSSERRFHQDSLMLACANPDTKPADIDRLVALGASVNAPNGANKTRPIHLACAYASQEIIEKLLALGAKPKLKTKQGHDCESIKMARLKNT